MKYRTPSAGEKHRNKAVDRKLPFSVVVPGVDHKIKENDGDALRAQEIGLKGTQLEDNSLGLQVHLKNNCISVTLTTDHPGERVYTFLSD